jgi:hypothetical protein
MTLPRKKSPEAYQRMREEVLRTRSRWRPILEELARDTPAPRRQLPDTIGTLSLAFLRKNPPRS